MPSSRYETLAGSRQAARQERQEIQGRERDRLCHGSRLSARACLVIDDNMQEAQFVTVKDGEIVAGDVIPLIDNSFEGKPLELDGEGVAYADGFFYVIGSHGHPRDSNHRLDPDKDAATIAAQIRP